MPDPDSPAAAPLPPLTHGRIWRIAAPIALANVTVPLLGLVDTAVVGQMGQAAPIGAVALGAVILSTVYWIFGFLRMGTTGLAAQALGAGDSAEGAAILQRGLLIALAAGLAFIALQVPLFHAAFRIAPASDGVEGLARDYLALRIWGAPATIAVYALTGWLIARENTRGVLVLQLFINGVNIALDVLFVLGLGWGVTGVAAATLIAEVSGAALGLWLCRAGLVGVGARLWDRARLTLMLRVNGDIAIRSVLLMACFTAFTFLSAAQGDGRLAANQILLQLVMLTAYLLDGVAFAVETLVGQAVGARRAADLRRAVRMCTLWALGGALALTVALALAGGPVIDLMTTAPDVRTLARDYLIWAVVAPLVGIGSFLLDGIFIGATRTAAMRNAMIVSAAGYALALWAFAPFANHGLWAALMAFFALRALTLGAVYPRIPADLDPPKDHPA